MGQVNKGGGASALIAAAPPAIFSGGGRQTAPASPDKAKGTQWRHSRNEKQVNNRGSQEKKRRKKSRKPSRMNLNKRNRVNKK